MAELNKEFLVNLQGKNFITYSGLIDLAHQMKLKSITTEIIQFPNEDNNNQCIIKAVATTEDDKVFEGYGDADPSNVNRMIAKHLIRMAETRAKARALRDLTNVGMTAIEELGGDEEPKGNNLASDKQVEFINSLMKQKKYSTNDMIAHTKETYNKNSSKELTPTEASEIIKMLNEIK